MTFPTVYQISNWNWNITRYTWTFFTHKTSTTQVTKKTVNPIQTSVKDIKLIEKQTNKVVNEFLYINSEVKTNTEIDKFFLKRNHYLIVKNNKVKKRKWQSIYKKMSRKLLITITVFVWRNCIFTHLTIKRTKGVFQRGGKHKKFIKCTENSGVP